MTNKTPLTSTCSKQDEAETLARFQKEAGEQTYLASLLSPALALWFTRSMREDNSCDIAIALEYVQKQAREADAKANQLQKELHEVRTDYAVIAVESNTKDALIEKLRNEKLVIDRGIQERIDLAEQRLHTAEARLEKISQCAGRAWLDGQNVTPEMIRVLLRFVPGDDED